MTKIQDFVNRVSPLVQESHDTVMNDGSFMYLVIDDFDELVLCHSASEALSTSSKSIMSTISEEDFIGYKFEHVVSSVVGYFGWEIMYREAVRTVSGLIGGGLKELDLEFVKLRPNYIDMTFDVIVDDDKEVHPETLLFQQSIMEQNIVEVINELMRFTHQELSMNVLFNCEVDS